MIDLSAIIAIFNGEYPIASQSSLVVVNHPLTIWNRAFDLAMRCNLKHKADLQKNIRLNAYKIIKSPLFDKLDLMSKKAYLEFAKEQPVFKEIRSPHGFKGLFKIKPAASHVFAEINALLKNITKELEFSRLSLHGVNAHKC